MSKDRCQSAVMFIAAASLCFLAGLGGVALSACTQSRSTLAQDLESHSSIQRQADDILKRMSAFLSSAKQFTFEARITDEEVLSGGDLEGDKREHQGTLAVAVRRPSAMRADYQGESDSKSFWYNGRTFALWEKSDNAYAKTFVAETIKEAFEELMDKFDFAVPLSELMYSDPYAVLLRNVESGTYEGQDSVDGVPCDRILLTKSKVDWELWIDNNSQPFPRKVVITYKESFGAPKYTAKFAKWNLSPELRDSSFSAKKPEGAKEVEFLHLARKMREY